MRRRLMRSVETLAPEARCVEVVSLQQRQPHQWAVFLATALAIGVPTFVVGTAVYPDGPPWFVFPAVFAALLAGQVAGTSYWALARTETDGLDEVKLARTSWLTGKATVIERSLPVPVEHSIKPQLLTSKLTIEGDSFLVGRALRSRVRSIVG